MQERTHHRYVYNGSALIAEIDATTRQVLRTFAWGATGELLMIHNRADTLGPQTYLPVHNATGSVTAMVRAVDNTFAATYEYDPNGNLLRAQGEYAKSNPFTWGGGWMDWETGLINAGSVYYSARLGRFINTAPSGGGDGLPACYGVAPTAGHLSLRIYAQPPARRSTGAAGWISVDPDAWAAYETAYAPALAAHEAALDEYQRSNRGGAPIEDYSADEFVADRFNQVGISIGGMDVGTTTLMGVYGMMHDYYGSIQAEWYETYYGTFRRLNPDGSRAGYYDAEMDQWVYPDGSTAPVSTAKFSTLSASEERTLERSLRSNSATNRETATNLLAKKYGIDTTGVTIKYVNSQPATQKYAAASMRPDGVMEVYPFAFSISTNLFAASIGHEIEIHWMEQAQKGRWWTDAQGAPFQEVQAFAYMLDNQDRFGLSEKEMLLIYKTLGDNFNRLNEENQYNALKGRYDTYDPAPKR